MKEKAGLRLWATVSLTARPADQLLVRVSHRWPNRWVPPSGRRVESGLLRGILEGTVRCQDPPWRCQLECSAVEWLPEEGRILVREAAALAVQSLVQGGGWEAVGGPGDHVA